MTRVATLSLLAAPARSSRLAGVIDPFTTCQVVSTNNTRTTETAASASLGQTTLVSRRRTGCR